MSAISTDPITDLYSPRSSTPRGSDRGSQRTEWSQSAVSIEIKYKRWVEQRRAANKRWNERNKEKTAIYKKKYAEKNKDKFVGYVTAYNRANIDKYKEYQRIYRTTKHSNTKYLKQLPFWGCNRTSLAA
jgi:hypothetical protein